MPRPLTMHPDALAIDIEHKRDRHKGNRQEAERRRGPVRAEIHIHSVGEEGKPGAEGAAHEVVGGVDGGGVGRVRVGEVKATISTSDPSGARQTLSGWLG